MNDLISLPDAAAYLGITENQLRKEVRSNNIGHYRLNRYRIGFSRADLDSYAAAKHRAPVARPGRRRAAS